MGILFWFALYLGDDIKVGDKGTLQYDGNVGSVEEFDGVGRVLPSVACTLDG